MGEVPTIRGKVPHRGQAVFQAGRNDHGGNPQDCQVNQLDRDLWAKS